MNTAKIQQYNGVYLPDGNWSSELHAEQKRNRIEN
jgi:hypothetical protein